LRFWDVALPEAARLIVQAAQQDRRLEVCFVNAHCCNVAARCAEYAALLEQMPFLFADGAGMALAARLEGRELRNNVNGTDLFPLLCAESAARKVPIALLGAAPGVARRCADRIERRFPGLRVTWIDHGFHSAGEEQTRIEQLNASPAQLLFVAKGVPQQELWMAQNRARLAIPVVLGVGALFDFYSGSVPRAPQLVRRLRGEWAYRLWREPRRLAGRYLLGNPAFIARAVWRRTFGRRPRGTQGGMS
jgi:N-acetylglucosaminyldiphosphoundecaprenol N-acetyl-beta-D-mannosaminyltransferase